MTQEYKLLAGGEWIWTSQKLEVVNPYNDEVVGIVSKGDRPEYEKAIASAEKAFEVMRKMPAYQRAEVLQRIVDGLKTRREDLARSITLEAGKPITDSRTEVSRTINTFSIAVEEAKRIPAEIIPLDLMAGSEERIGIIRRFPLGPVLGISPFNFPLNLVAHKVAPAIASGNTIIIKPASMTPMTALILGEIVDDAGLVKGGLSVIPSSGSAADKYISDERIKKITFTGSPAVGWSIKARAAKKRVTLELGGNAGVIVHSDGDVRFASKRCAVGAFSFAGQVCISVQRVFVHEDVLDAFLEGLKEEISCLKMGDPMDETTTLAPMIEKGEADRTEAWVEEAVRDGATVVVGGRRKGSFFEPTVLTNTKPVMKVCSNEVFAPLVVVEKYTNFKDAVNEVNDSMYGLQAGVFTSDIKRAFHAFNEIEVGGVIINDIPTYRVDHMPYGGVKESGFGREGVKYAIEEMTEMRLMALKT
jgi:acyl-CoA reductase-like NAD-dependent aldehyde dehydrogenase